MLRSTRRKRDREGGQIIVLFALVLVVILAFSALVIDIGLLRNNRGTLVNAMDAGALAGGTLLPVDGSAPNGQGALNAAAIRDRIIKTVSATYPGLVEGTDYRIEYRCLIGADPATGAPLITRDIPIVCDPHFSLGHNPANGDFIGAGSTRNSSCNPARGDKCNVVQLNGAINQRFTFGRAVGVNGVSTGTIVSAACNGPCGEPPFAPLDVVVIIDRSGSMDGDERNLRDAASAVLKVYNPAVQHVALAMLGPSTLTATCGSSPGVHAIPLDILPQPQQQPPDLQQDTSAANSSNGAATLVINRPSNSGNINGQFLIAGIAVDGPAGLNVTAPTGWTPIRRTDNGTNGANMSLFSYYKFAGNNEPTTYTWTLSSNRRAAGGIMRYSGVNTTNPINASSSNTGNGGNQSNLRASSITTTTDDAALVGLYASDTHTSIDDGDGMNREFDIANPSNGGPTIMGAQDTDDNAGQTGDKDGDADDAAQWAAQLIALRPVPVAPVVQEYGTDTTADMSKWVVVGLTGTGPGAVVNESYINGTQLNTSSGIVKAINCVTNSNLSSTGTNLSTPLDMARVYLQTKGRTGADVKKGIIFETDGAPNYNNTGDPQNYTCAASRAAADRAKTANIEIFAIGFDVGNESCPDGGGSAINLLGGIASGPIVNGSNCNNNGNENRDGDHFFCEPAGSDLTSVFQAAAADLAGIRSHLVQPYPAPIVTGIGPNQGSRNGGTVVTITGDNFTGATSVRFGGVNALSFTILSDSSIRATAPAGGVGTTVDIRVSTPGGSSPVSGADRYTYN